MPAWTGVENIALPEFDPRIFWPIASRYIDWATSARNFLALDTYKGKACPRKDYEGPDGEWRYGSTISLTSALDGVGGERHAPVTLFPGMTRYEAGRAPGPVWAGKKNLVPQPASIPGPSSP